MTVYLVKEHQGNSISYDSNYAYDDVRDVCISYEKAEECIKNYKLPTINKNESPWCEGALSILEDGEYFYIDMAVRQAYKKKGNDENYVILWWEIEEKEVIE